MSLKDTHGPKSSTIAQTSIKKNMVWPNFFLMNVFFSLKGSKLFIIISSSTAWPIKAIFNVVPAWDLGHMTKMAATPIYGKSPSKFFFSGTGGLISTKLGV